MLTTLHFHVYLALPQTCYGWLLHLYLLAMYPIGGGRGIWAMLGCFVDTKLGRVSAEHAEVNRVPDPFVGLGDS